MNCIVCDRDLREVFNDEDYNQPYAGTAFKSYGHYGSTIFDPMDGKSFIELYICDTCLRDKSDNIYTAQDSPAPVFKIWNPDG